jgi:cell division topological specificity factor
MGSFLERLSGKKTSSADRARERLKFVLIHDRADISPGQMEKLKNELIKVIGKYVDIDPSAVHIDVAQDGREQRLVADIPLRISGSRKRNGS